MTKETRHLLCIQKTLAQDTRTRGRSHPKYGTKTAYWQKLRRNIHILAKLYDAVHNDLRNIKRKKGTELPRGRTTRFELRYGVRRQRANEAKRGRVNLRRKHYVLRFSDTVWFGRTRFQTKGMQHDDACVVHCRQKKQRPVRDATKIRCAGGWLKTQQ